MTGLLWINYAGYKDAKSADKNFAYIIKFIYYYEIYMDRCKFLLEK